MTGTQGLLLFASGAVCCGILSWLAIVSKEPDAQAIPLVACYACLFLVYWLAVRWLEVRAGRNAHSPALVLASAVLLRLILVPAPPLLDDDIYRYRWDGKLLAHGKNPYAYPPEAPQLAPLQAGDPLFDRIGFRDIPAVYPPVSQALFAIGYALSPNSIWGIKGVTLLCDTGVILAIGGLLRALGLPAWRSAIYAWNPLVLKEFANSGHHDAVGIFLLVTGLWTLIAGRRFLPAISFAMATLVKPIVLLLAPALWRRLPPREWIVWTALVVIGYLPFAAIGMPRLFAGLRLYSLHWEMNDSLFALIQAALGGPVPSHNAGFLFETNPAARVMVFALWAMLAVAAIASIERARRDRQPESHAERRAEVVMLWWMGILLSGVLALTPTMDPWYVCWLVPFLCVFRWPAGLALTATVSLSYLYYWHDRDIWWLRPTEFVPVAALLAYAIVVRYSGSRKESKRPGS